MDLNEFPVSVIATLLTHRGLCRPGADHRVRALAENRTDAAGRDYDSVGREGANLHRTQIHSADAAADAVRIQHRRKKFPRLELRDFAFGLVAANLLIQSVKKLLASGGPGKRGAMVQRSPEAPEVEQALRSPIKRHPHAVEEINDP